MSFGTEQYSKALEMIIDKAERAGILLVAAAGNNGSAENTTEYPAAYKEVIAVGSVDSKMRCAKNSARGEAVELMAPGENVPITSSFDGISIGSGTSYAAPHISAVAAMLWSDCVSWDAQKLRALLRAGARKLKGNDTGYGLVDYAYCKKIQKEFGKEYNPQNTQDVENLYNNEKNLQTYDMPKVVANWNTAGHTQLVTTAVKGDATWQEAYDADKRKVIKQVSAFVDSGKGTSGGETVSLPSVSMLHAKGDTNYVATIKYLYKLAIKQKKNPKEKITAIMEEHTDYYGLYSNIGELRKLKKAVNIVCKEEKEINDVGYGSKGKERSFRILAMAVHVAGDAFAHKAIIYNNKAVKDVIRGDENIYFTKTSVDAIIKRIENSYLTTSGITDYAMNKDVRSKSHQAYGDNPNFCPRRYLYGAQNVVCDLLKRYYKKEGSFDIKVFHNFGQGDKKNNISQYRLADYVAEANGGALPGGIDWTTYSRGDTTQSK